MLNELDKKHISNDIMKDFLSMAMTQRRWVGGGAERQYLRFKTTLDAAVLFGEELTSILDIGCGFGDFCFYLKNLKSSIKYTGVDINESLIGVAKRSFVIQIFIWELLIHVRSKMVRQIWWWKTEFLMQSSIFKINLIT